jgi:hypothetical protein
VLLSVSHRTAIAALGGLAIVGFTAWVRAGHASPGTGITPTYDKQTGKLTQLAYDSDRDGRPDTWTDMDGATPLRTRIDRNGDGKIDRWEEYDAAGRLAKIGWSRLDNGVADAWISPRPDGAIDRIEVSSTGDAHQIDRWEYYDVARSGPEGPGPLIRAEEDTVGDGKPHKWETFRDGALETVAFDENGDGLVDRRLTYRGSALVLIESQPDASGRLTVRTVVKPRLPH